MQVKCDSCGAPVAARDVNLERMLAKCERCNAVFDIGAQVPHGEGPLRQRRLVAMPRNIRLVADDVEMSGESYRTNAATHPHVVLERRWFTPALIFMVFFCLFWDGFLVVWYGAVLSGKGHPSAVMALFPLIHVSVGIFITYTTLCGFVNRTRIAVENGVLSVRHGPLPWRGNRDIPLSNLAQLFCREQVGSKGSRSYSLNALLKEGDSVPLIKSLNEPDQALYIEQLLEKRLGIVDVPVAGEYT
jgi:hypothetical protein